MYPVDPFDVDRLRLTGDLPLAKNPKRTPRRKLGMFLKGPIPWPWLEQAARLPGQALAMGLVAWHLKGLKKSDTFRMEPSKARSLGMSPRVARRGLKALEDAGLVAVDRHRGRSPTVTVLSA